MNTSKILIIAAHPDDEILGCGGILSKYSQDSISEILFIGEGSSCRFRDLDNSDQIKKAIFEREDAAKKAKSLLNVDNISFDLFEIKSR